MRQKGRIKNKKERAYKIRNDALGLGLGLG
jgi:hypothetical protein